MIGVSFYVVWQAVQSEQFADFITKQINSFLIEETGGEVSLGSITVQMLPPGVSLNDIEVQSLEIGEHKLSVVASQVDLYFSIFAFFSQSLSLSDIIVNQASIRIEQSPLLNSKGEIQFGKKSKKSKKINLPDYKSLMPLLKELPFDSLQGNKIVVESNEQQYFSLEQLSLEKGLFSYDFALTVHDLRKIKDLTKIVAGGVDQVSVSGVIEDDQIRIGSWNIYKGFIFCGGTGIYKKGLELNGNAYGDLFDIAELFRFNKLVRVTSAEVSSSFNFKMYKDFELSLDANLKNGNSFFSRFKAGKAKVLLNSDGLSIKSLNLSDGEQIVDLRESVQLFSFKGTKKNLSAKLKLKNAGKNIILDSIRKTLKPVDLRMFGSVDLNFDGKILEIETGENFYVTNFILGDRLKPVLKLDNMKIARFKLDFLTKVVKGSPKVQYIGELNLNEIPLYTSGVINEGVGTFVINSSFLDFKKLGAIAGNEIEGVGKTNISATVTKESRVMNVRGEYSGLKVKGHFLGDAVANIDIDFNKKLLTIKRLVSRESDKLEVTGKVSFEADQLVELSGKIQRHSYKFIKSLLYPIIKNVRGLPENGEGVFDLSFNIQGPLKNKEKLRLDATGSGTRLFFFNEDFDNFKLFVEMQDSVMQFKNIVLRKGFAFFKGSADFDLRSKSKKLDFQMKRWPTREFNIMTKYTPQLDCIMDGRLVGEISAATSNAKGDIKLSKCRLKNRSYGPGSIEAQLMDQQINYSVNLFDSAILSKGFLSLAKRKKSQIEGKVQSRELSHIAQIFFAKDVKRFDVFPDDVFSFNASFFKEDISSLDFQLGSNREKYIVINKGEISKWEFSTNKESGSLETIGRGNFSKKFEVINNISFTKDFIAPLLPIAELKTGRLGIKNRIAKSKGGLVSNTLEVTGSDFSGTFNQTLNSFERVNFRIKGQNKNIVVDKIEGKIGRGKFKLKGLVGLEKNLPSLNLVYEIDKVDWKILNKSSVIISGNGSIVGGQFPYSLEGKVILNGGYIKNEIADFKKFRAKEVNKYLPQVQEEKRVEKLRLGLNVSMLRPLIVSNSLINIGFEGPLTIGGSDVKPQLGGRISLANLENRLFFKGQEFVFSKGEINFLGTESTINPELNFKSTTQINNYQVFLALNGRLKQFNLELSSDPPLPRNEVLSLITLGVTSDTSRNLETKQREALTSLGIGSFLLDQFKISKGLKESLGIKLSISSEVSENEEQLIANRKSESSSVQTVNSNTKVELKKKLTKAMDLSVSSTMGDGVSQKQSMNLNYNINEYISAEGVYELNSREDGEENFNNTSAGADIKFKWFFK